MTGSSMFPRESTVKVSAENRERQIEMRGQKMLQIDDEEREGLLVLIIKYCRIQEFLHAISYLKKLLQFFMHSSQFNIYSNTYIFDL